MSHDQRAYGRADRPRRVRDVPGDCGGEGAIINVGPDGPRISSALRVEPLHALAALQLPRRNVYAARAIVRLAASHRLLSFRCASRRDVGCPSATRSRPAILGLLRVRACRHTARSHANADERSPSIPVSRDGGLSYNSMTYDREQMATRRHMQAAPPISGQHGRSQPQRP